MKRNLLPLGAVIACLFSLSAVPATAGAAQQDRPEPPKIIRKSGGVLQGSATRRVEPVYPPLAKSAQVNGAVVVEVTVDEEGKVIAARAISGHPLLKGAAVTAARGWEFTPTTLQDTPVKVIGTITFNFNLNFPEDIETLKQQIAEKPNDAQLYRKLGEAYYADGQTEAAIGAFRQALVLQPDDVRGWMALGRLYEGKDRGDEAIDAYKQAAQLDPTNAAGLAFWRIGEIYAARQHYREAIEAYKQAAERYDRKDFILDRLYASLGVAYLKLGDKDSAMQQVQVLKEMGSRLADELLKQINDQQ